MYQEMVQRAGLGDPAVTSCPNCDVGIACSCQGLGDYSPMIQRGGLGDYWNMVQRGGLGLTLPGAAPTVDFPSFTSNDPAVPPSDVSMPVDPGSSDFASIPSDYPSFDTPTAAPDIAQQILERAITFQPPAGDTTGQSIIDGVATGTAFVPGVGPIASSVMLTVNHFFQAFGAWLHIGAGRKEADLITGPPYHIQDEVFHQIQNIAAQGLTSTSVPQLQSLVIELQQLRSAWLTFLSNTSHFRDGRASTQAADTIMPYLDGTCGYHWPPPFIPDFVTDCGTVHPTPTGNAWPGDFGYGSGLLGALKKRIIDYGGQLPALQLTQGPTGIPGLYPSIPGTSYLPQAGTLPPAGILPSYGPNVQPGGGISTTALLVGAGLLLTML